MCEPSIRRNTNYKIIKTLSSLFLKLYFITYSLISNSVNIQIIINILFQEMLVILPKGFIYIKCLTIIMKIYN